MKALFHTFYLFSGVLSFSLYGMGSTEVSSVNGTPVVAPKVVRQGESNATTPQTPKRVSDLRWAKELNIEGGTAIGSVGRTYGSLSPRTSKK